MTKSDESESTRIAPATSGFVCQVVHISELSSERLSLQEAAIAPQGTNPKVAERYKLGRIAAKRCLAQFGERSVSILRGDGGEPLFPEGFVGSISHTDDTAAAVVGRSEEFLGLGIDIESQSRKLNKSIIDRIGTAQEKRWVKESPADRSLMVFCTKESVYKALFPLHRKRMDFKDVACVWNDEHQAFISTLLTDFGAPWDAGATVLTLCQPTDGFIVAVTVIDQPQAEED